MPEPPAPTPPMTLPTMAPTEPETEETAPPTTQAPPETAPTEPSAEPLTEPATEDDAEAELQRQLAGLTTEEKVAQLFFVTPEALTQISGAATVAGETTRAAFEEFPVGGILYMGQNLVSPDQAKALLSGMQAISLDRIGLPVFLGVDEEGGSVARISGNSAFAVGPYPNMSSLDGDTRRAAEIGTELGQYLADLGFNLDFAPVADVLVNPENTVVRERAFSTDAGEVCAMCAAFSDALQAGGVLACYKHFPGHGATTADSHTGSAVSDRTPEQLRTCELLPFQDATARKIPFLMVGHISLPRVTGDDVPASLSPALVQGLLRQELGYDGVVITDALNMGAIRQRYSPEEAVVQAFLAGNDMLLVSDELPACYQAVLDAVVDGTISTERLDASVLRILRAKLLLAS